MRYFAAIAVLVCILVAVSGMTRAQQQTVQCYYDVPKAGVTTTHVKNEIKKQGIQTEPRQLTSAQATKISAILHKQDNRVGLFNAAMMYDLQFIQSAAIVMGKKSRWHVTCLVNGVVLASIRRVLTK